ncbi:MAG TPA: SRPBCC domain-containing protein [Vicinamibacterales bacterium]|nr:SRPBCC domain-containing protein [Vicinamibacterales bacterium]
MTASDDPGTLVIQRRIPVPRERVFAAWLDPKSLAKWMCPGNVTHAVVDLEPRVGGTFRIVMEHGRGDTEHWGEYVTIEPPSRLAFTWTSANTDRHPTLVTVELVDRGGSTDLTLTHRRLPVAKVEPHRKGWTDIVRKLEETLACQP